MNGTAGFDAATDTSFLPTMLRIVLSASRPTTAGLLGKVASSSSPPHSAYRRARVFTDFPDLGSRPLDRRTISSSSSRQADITLTVDGKEVTVPQGSPHSHLVRSPLNVAFRQVLLSSKPAKLLARLSLGMTLFAIHSVSSSPFVSSHFRFCYHDRLAIFVVHRMLSLTF